MRVVSFWSFGAPSGEILWFGVLFTKYELIWGCFFKKILLYRNFLLNAPSKDAYFEKSPSNHSILRLVSRILKNVLKSFSISQNQRHLQKSNSRIRLTNLQILWPSLKVLISDWPFIFLVGGFFRGGWFLGSLFFVFVFVYFGFVGGCCWWKIN